MRTPQYIVVAAALFAACSSDRPLATEAAVPNRSHPVFVSTNATQNVSEPLSFTLTPAVCSALGTTVTGTGISHIVLHLSPDANGNVHFSFSNTVNGTARGADGSFYRFSYQLNERTTTEPVPPFTVNLVDKFLLVGHGKTQKITVKFHDTFVVNPDGSITDLNFRVRGDPGCDGI